MTGGGGNAPPMQPASNGGEFLLSLLQRCNQQSQPTVPSQSPPQQEEAPQFPIPIPVIPSHQQHQLQQTLALDPAIAAVGPSVPFASPSVQSNDRGALSRQPWPHDPNLPPGLLGFQQNNSWQNNFHGSSQSGVLGDDGLQRLGFSSSTAQIHNLEQHRQQLQFGSFRGDTQTPEDFLNLNSMLNVKKELEVGSEIRNLNGLERNRQFEPQLQSNLSSDLRQHDQSGGWKQQHHGSNYRSVETRMPPPGFWNKPRGGNWDNVSRRRELYGELGIRNRPLSSEDKSLREVDVGLTRQLDYPGPPAGSKLHAVTASDVKESLMNLDAEHGNNDGHDLDDASEELVGSLLLDGESDDKIEKKQNRHFRDKEYRSDARGLRILSHRMRMLKRQMECRRDIDSFTVPFLAIYESLIPPEDEKAKQKQLLTLLEKLVNKEWPEARLFLYGSCANTFGVLKSDIDVCLAIQDADVDKSGMLLKLAEILQSDNLQNVQALTHARVPIVKLMDPVTGISSDICINNVLAVVNSKLLRDYAQIDVRLRQLAFIVKHWAKSRGVNATYQGTLSSYAYVLMCIHFLQLRRPAILPCLQEMATTYSVTVDDVECAYFDQVERLRRFGSHNKETIAQLVWAFFSYWAYRHDYANDVISVRKGSIISKREKDWTRRIGKDRHLICIEDPFETSHDLGRVVDKYSIKVLREEFERAANIMQYDPNPCVTLFDPYVSAT